jgi:hypothetical protein
MANISLSWQPFQKRCRGSNFKNVVVAIVSQTLPWHQNLKFRRGMKL